MTDCSHVYEIVEGKDYSYCSAPATVVVLGNPFCEEHGKEQRYDLLFGNGG